MVSDEAAASVVSFILAGVVVIAALGVIVLTTDDIGRADQRGDVAAEQRHAQADGLLKLLLDSPGIKADGTSPWAPTSASDPAADTLVRFGLLDHQTGNLNLTKFENLRLAPFAADDDDGLVNYEEALGQLGLDGEALDFHIRVYPTLADVRERLAKGIRDTHLTVTYLGDIDGTSSSVPSWTDPVCDVSPYDADYYRISLDVSNDGGTQTQFQAYLKIDDGTGGADPEFSEVSPIVPAGGTASIEFDVPATNNVDCEDGTEFQITISDTAASLGSQTYTSFTRIGTPTQDNNDFIVELDQQNYVAGDTVTVWYEGVSGGDALSWDLRETDDAVAAIVSPIADHSGNVTAANQAKDRFFTFTVPSTTSATAWHRLVVSNDNTGQSHSVLVAFRRDDSVALEGYDPSAPAATDAMAAEIAYLEDLAEHFCPAHYDDASSTWMDTSLIGRPDAPETLAERCSERSSGIPGWQGGDVFWDDKDVVAALCERLVAGSSDGSCPNGAAGTLDWTNLLVVGSNVDHNSMTKATFKWPLEAWVAAGGTVIAFGSPSTTTEWLQPIFHVGHKSSSGGISTPDQTHPLLNRPNQLDYLNYDNQGEGWRFKTSNGAANFTTVVKQGSDPITSISNPGAYGKGNVIITTWLPYDPYGDGSNPIEGPALMDNFITQAYRDLFLDYGPPIPADAQAVPALGRAQIAHTELGLIDLDIQLFVFSG